jgi:C4-dicarboxylate transporter DctM subunit
MTFAVFLASFVVLIAIGVPISIALGVAGLAMAAVIPDLSMMMALTLFLRNACSSASTCFCCWPSRSSSSGALMEVGGTARRLVDFASAVVGGFRGGLGHVTVLSSMFFAGISGSASADTAAVGSVMIPAMKRKGYDGPFAAALQAGAGALGPIIPPECSDGDLRGDR